LGAAVGLSGLIRTGHWGQEVQQGAPDVALAVRPAQPKPDLRVSHFNPCRRAACEGWLGLGFGEGGLGGGGPLVGKCKKLRLGFPKRCLTPFGTLVLFRLL